MYCLTYMQGAPNVRMPRLRSPIVLVHGLFGFSRLRLGPWVLVDYFHGVVPALARSGNRVLVAQLSPTAGIARRAAQLKALLDREAPREPVHILAHSMGGLDARWMIAQLGMAPRVLSLTTLGTPHRGSPMADWALPRMVRLVGPLFDCLGLPRQAFSDLTVAACRAFNEQTPDAPQVRYFSVAGKIDPGRLFPSWQLSEPIVSKAEGPNDGIVSLSSAAWGEACEVWDGDHMSLVNWPQPFVGPRQNDHLPAYAALLGRLHDEGF
jgi:triacylglycerol lipase